MKVWRWVLLLVVIAALAAFGWHWVAEDPGYVLLRLRGWRVETTVVAAILILLLAWAVLTALWRLARWPFGAFSRRHRRLSQQRLGEGLVALIEGRQLPKIGRDLGLFLARTLFRGSDLSMVTRDKKADVALFSDNVELCDITENLVFSDPYFEAAMNRHTTPQLDGLVAELRRDRDLKVEAQRMKHLFASKAETLCHGDLHTGSVMVTDDETRVIDPEFAFYGPLSFDVGMLIANLWMSYFSQSGHETTAGDRDGMRAYLLDTVDTVWATFRAEFADLWRSERNGILYQASLFEDRDDPLGAEQALNMVIDDIFTEMLGFAGIEMHRRILGLAHNADFETIADPDRRAACESKALKLGRHLAVNRHRIRSLTDIRETAERLQKEILS